MARQRALLLLHATGLSMTLLLASLALTATAQATSLINRVELPVTSISPANGATIPLPTAGIPFEVQSSVVFNGEGCNGLPHLTVSTQDVLDQIPGSAFEGELASDYMVDFRLLVPSQAYPGLDSGVSGFVPNGHWWSSTPGTYYWQVAGSCNAGLELTQYISPVYTLVIAPPAPAPAPAPPSPTSPVPEPIPPLTPAEAHRIVATTIQERTGRNAHRLSDRCTRQNADRLTCKASWTSSVHLSSSTLLYAGTFLLEQQSNGFHSSFVGLRERYGCSRRFRAKRCASTVHWHQVP